MLPWTRISRERVAQAPAPEEAFASETLARLAELRARFGGHPEWMELTMDERRLAFARWLVECGRLSEKA
jgi:hypothetical protein